MRHDDKLREVLKLVKPSSIIHLLQQGVNLEKLTLSANEHLLNEHECDRARNIIADGRIFLSLLRGDLPS
jgi:hypothetical protein